MGQKKSRRERREHQQQRAVATGDVTALRQLVERSAAGAASAIAKALASPPADTAQAAELEALALGLTARLRRGGDPDKALVLAAAGRRRTPAFRMEEAAAAFASGRDDVASAIAAADETVAAALGPLLAAVRGEVAGSSPAEGELRALHAAARAVAHAVRGEPDPARAIIGRIPVGDRAAVFGKEIAAAADLARPERAAHAAEILDGSPRLHAGPARAAMLAEVAVGDGAVGALPERVKGDPVVTRRAALAAASAAPRSAGVAVEMVRAMGPDAFADRATASLYHGFALIRADPASAQRSFDRAIQLGADVVEALRGKAQAAFAAAHRHEPESPGGARALRDAGSAYDRLAHALARLPEGAPLAAAAGARAARCWIDAGDPRPALAAVQRARPLSGGKQIDRLDLLAADATGFDDLKEAERRVDAVLARSPGDVEAWTLKQAMVRAQGDAARADRLVVDAAAATHHPALIEAARTFRIERRELAPFDGLVPGQASAGQLARELARATTETDDPWPLAEKHRAALGEGARVAFDAAAFVIAATRGGDRLAETRLREGLVAWQQAPVELARLALVAVAANLAHLLLAAALPLDARATRIVAEALLAADLRPLANKLLPRFAAELTRDEVTRFRGSGKAGRASKVDPDDAVLALDAALAPEFSILDELEEDLDEMDEDLDELDLEESLGAGVLPIALRALGIPARDLAGLPPDARRQLERRIVELMQQPPTDANLGRLAKALNEAKIPVPPILGGKQKGRR